MQVDYKAPGEEVSNEDRCRVSGQAAMNQVQNFEDANITKREATAPTRAMLVGVTSP